MWAVAVGVLIVLACGKPAGGSPAPTGRSRTSVDVSATVANAAPMGPNEAGLVFPYRRDLTAFVGADACRTCHADQHAQWELSPHGRAMAEPASETVLGDFRDVTVPIPHGEARCSTRDGQYLVTVAGPDGEHEHRVDLVLASGRQHQVYLTKLGDDYAVLPVIWLTPTKQWISSDAYVPASADSAHARYWQRAELINHRCFDCHLSQVQVDYSADGGAPRTRWRDLSVNCESCHGSGRAHVEARRAGTVDTNYGDLRGLSKNDEIDLCGQCHGAHLPLQVDGPKANVPLTYYMTLADEGFRADATQRGVSYQHAGHMVGPCYLRADLKCSSCHDPHTGEARDLAGRSAAGQHSDRQCTVCHPQFGAESVVLAHSRHARSVRCIDCHMSSSWIHDDPALMQRTADHSISIPRPRESVQFGHPNACTACHEGKPATWALDVLTQWGATKGTTARPWVETFAHARRGDRVTKRLVAVLDDYAAGAFVQLSALVVLQEQPRDETIVPALLAWSEHADPRTRFEALYALTRHDVAHVATWRAKGIADASALVRTMTFVHLPSGDKAELAAFFADIRRVAILPPFDLLFATAARLATAGERKAAGEVLEVARRYAPTRLAAQIPRISP